MINTEFIKDGLQNKNFVMLMFSATFMFGILTYFNNHEITFAFLFSFFIILLGVFKIFSLRRILVLTFVFYFGFFLTAYKIRNYDELVKYAPIKTEFQGRIISNPISPEQGKVKFFMQVNAVGTEKISGKALVTINSGNDNIDNLKIGQEIILNGNLRKPFSSTNPSQFDYASYLKNYNVYTVIYSNDENFELIKGKKYLKWEFLKFLNNQRTQIMKVHSKYLKNPNLEILGGIVFGDDAVPAPEKIKKSFINSGLLHVLAASGMNVAFIFGFWVSILKILRIGFRFRIISGMCMIILYTLMTGLGPSVIRAALMLLFVLVGKLIDRDAHSISLLSFVAVLMLIYNPAFINDVSFQLSFMVTLGLLFSVNIFSEKLVKIPDWIKNPVLIPLIAQIWVAPIQMYYFNTLSLYSIFANISAVSLLSIISFCGFISSAFALIKPIADIECMVFDFFNNYLLNILVKISDFFGNLPHCIIETSHPEIYQLIIYYLMIVIVTLLIKYNRFKNALACLVCLSFVLCFTNLRVISKNLEIIAFDVGNADSFLIKTPQNKYFFIDTGKAPYQSGNTQAKIIMLKYLKDRGIKNINGIIVTHFDSDHSGGAVDMIENLKVDNLYLNTRETTTATGKNIFKTAKEINQKYTIVENNKTIYSEPNLNIKVYKADVDGRGGINESSIITLLSYKDFDMLFMGDAGYGTFHSLENDIARNVEVLKVGHHGGPNVVDNDMIEYLGNDVSLISTGLNYFGHPNKGTLDILRKTYILRTDLLNSIKITSNGEKYKIYSYDTQDKKYKINQIFSVK